MNSEPQNPYKRIADYIESLPKDILTSYNKTTPQEFEDHVLPFAIYKGLPQNIERIADQINKSFHFGIYDGCFVLMRRLTETLLILSYRALGIEQEIIDQDGSYLKLSKIINKAETSKALALTHNSKGSLKSFKLGGDLSAHNPYFCATKKDVSNFRLHYRALIEELLHKANLIK